MNTLKNHIVRILVAALAVVSLLPAVAAADTTPPTTPPTTQSGTNTGSSNILQAGCNSAGASTSSSICAAAPKDNAQSMVQIVINILFTILGIIAVLMIVVGGLRYTLSNGDANAIKGAKNTIFYSVIGLVVAILAFAIVNFLLASLK